MNRELELYSEFERLKNIEKVIKEQLPSLKLTIQKLIDENPDRAWLIEKDFDNWHSIKMLNEAITKRKGGP